MAKLQFFQKFSIYLWEFVLLFKILNYLFDVMKS